MPSSRDEQESALPRAWTGVRPISVRCQLVHQRVWSRSTRCAACRACPLLIHKETRNAKSRVENDFGLPGPLVLPWITTHRPRFATLIRIFGEIGPAEASRKERRESRSTGLTVSLRISGDPGDVALYALCNGHLLDPEGSLRHSRTRSHPPFLSTFIGTPKEGGME
jgi:hypothetical protein